MVESTESTQPQYPVTIWEGIAIAAGAVFLVAIGLAGLAYKFFNNAADPQRASLIANSLMEYTLPAGDRGVFGANLGGAKVAIVSTPSFPRDVSTLTPEKVPTLSGVEMFIARVPLDIETGTSNNSSDSSTNSGSDYDLFSSPDFSFSYRAGEDFNVTAERVEEKQFCGSMVPVRIQEGQLTLSSQLPTIFAVKYDAIATFENSKRQVTVTAIGNTAKADAVSVFSSLRCK